ncbi:MAG: hypothetical protein HFF20_02200 [Oscillospiraceae bacterium]|nr:hypothetical protein [Oscillospiraceae bacterium]MCI9548029.1 hypothetical protein [Oscillospiraceae bacterium]
MKNIKKRCAALALTAALALSLAQPALASYALGTELSAQTTPLGTGTELTAQSLWSASKSDLRTEHYVTYSPNSTVKPVVFSGTYVASTNTVQSAAAQLESQGLRVAAAVNGGFFNTDGTIVGMLMTDGVLRSLDVENYVLLGFTNDGKVFIDESRPSMSASWTAVEYVYPDPQPDPAATPGPGQDPAVSPDPSATSDPGSLDPAPIPTPDPVPVTVERTFPVAGFNAYRNANHLGGLYLYNKDFSSRVSSHGTSVSAILRPLSPEGLKLSGTYAFEVVSVTDTAQEGAAFDGNIPEGCYMLYGEDRGNPELLAALRGMQAGSRVTLTIGGAGEQWNNAAYGVSGMYSLLRNGQIVSGLPATPNPYTAVGVKADGTAIFYTIDGRQSGYSVGATYAQVAERLQELGCVSAVALDGGGSTTLGATLPGSTGFSVVNQPSTAGRKINNTIALVSPAGADILTPGAYVTAQQRVVLAGSKLPVTAGGYDSAGRPTGQTYVDLTATGGSVVGGVYTAGATPGTYTISAGQTGALTVEVVDELSALTVIRKDNGARVTALNLEPGDGVDLTAKGSWWNLSVAMGEEDLTWTADEAVGTIDAAGRFTAGRRSAQGSVTVSAGGRSVTIPVTVSSEVPFTDISGHWSEDYIVQMYQLGLTTGYGQEDGTAVYLPDNPLTRAELLAFLTRVLGVDETAYYTVETPFADNTSIPNWAQLYVQAMYTLGVLKGSERDGKLYADVDSYVTREETMTFLGRVLAASQSADLSAFPDASSVSDWASPHVQTLVGLGIVGGSNGYLEPGANIDRAAIAKLLVEVYPLDKALLVPRLDLIS